MSETRPHQTSSAWNYNYIFIHENGLEHCSGTYQSFPQHGVDHRAINITANNNSSGRHSGQVTESVVWDRTARSIWAQQLVVLRAQALGPQRPLTYNSVFLSALNHYKSLFLLKYSVWVLIIPVTLCSPSVFSPTVVCLIKATSPASSTRHLQGPKIRS